MNTKDIEKFDNEFRALVERYADIHAVCVFVTRFDENGKPVIASMGTQPLNNYVDSAIAAYESMPVN